jgi:hypothetical protein
MYDVTLSNTGYFIVGSVCRVQETLIKKYKEEQAAEAASK